MDSDKYLKDIQDIKTLMDRSSQFISLSGLSGILAGIYALIGAYITHVLLSNHGSYDVDIQSDTFRNIILTAIAVMGMSVLTALVLTQLKARKVGESVWNATSRRMIVNFMIPLLTGGIFAVLLLKTQHYTIIAAVMLIFYGLACVNASKYTLRDVRYLGLTIIVLGLLATAFPTSALLFWSLGFGVCHIFYGAIMYFKYDRK